MVVQLCLALCYPMNCSPTGSSVYRISQGRIPETVAIFSSSGSSQPRDRTHISCVSCIGRLILYHRVTWEAHLSIYTHTYIYDLEEPTRLGHEWTGWLTFSQGERQGLLSMKTQQTAGKMRLKREKALSSP